MRVIAGLCRGKKLKSPPGMTTRPTADRVKESLFNIISNQINFDGCIVLDICAGTGSLGIESLSRGASSCTFIEKDITVSQILKTNLICCKLDQKSKIMTMESQTALKLLSKQGQHFDLVFFDPPYESGLYEHIAGLLDQLGLLTEHSLFIAECSSQNVLPSAFGQLVKTDRRVYGDTALEFFTLEAV
ncbi:MAG: 16S rRNA (guanine(966)-N(2))-methyltransferase RsmD [Geobacter sp.]|nr:16S rRNA (guanine(966)-N(2))-methyltransferase RsmD [Geobacter sp.]